VIFGHGSQVSADQIPALARGRAGAALVKSFDRAELLATVARLSNGAAWS
jgi:hypothetical protein